MTDRPLERFLGGPPAQVAIRLIVLSLIIGFVLYMLDLQPLALLRGIGMTVRRSIEFLAQFGFETFSSLLIYLGYGAVIVIPVFLIARLIALRNRR